jgi:hypothetical protein
VATGEPKFEIPLKALWLPAGAGVKSGRTIFYHMHMLYLWYIGVLARAALHSTGDRCVHGGMLRCYTGNCH